MDELNALLNLLGGEHGKIAQVLAWIGAARIAFKPIQKRLQETIESIIRVINETPDKSDDEWMRLLFKKKWYRIASILLELVSIKLPNEQSIIPNANTNDKQIK